MGSFKASARLSKSNKGTQSKKEAQMAASTAKSAPKRYIVFSLTGKEYASHYLAVRVEENARLSEQEKAGLLEVFDVTPSGTPRKNMYFKQWLPNVREKMAGYVFYWLCPADVCTLAEAKAAVADILDAQPAKKERTMKVAKGAKGKTTKAPAKQAAKTDKRVVVEF